MTDHPSELDLSLDAVDEAFKRSIAQAYVDLNTFGVAPIKTFEDAKGQARKTRDFARLARRTAIEIMNESPTEPPPPAPKKEMIR